MSDKGPTKRELLDCITELVHCIRHPHGVSAEACSRSDTIERVHRAERMVHRAELVATAVCRHRAKAAKAANP